MKRQLREQERTSAPFSSGLGKDTVGNSGSGCCCDSTGITGGSPKVLKALSTNAWPTPCIDVLTNFKVVAELVSLLHRVSHLNAGELQLWTQSHLDEQRAEMDEKYLSLISSVTSRQTLDEETTLVSQESGSRFAVIASAMPVSWGEMIWSENH